MLEDIRHTLITTKQYIRFDPFGRLAQHCLTGGRVVNIETRNPTSVNTEGKRVLNEVFSNVGQC